MIQQECNDLCNVKRHRLMQRFLQRHKLSMFCCKGGSFFCRYIQQHSIAYCTVLHTTHAVSRILGWRARAAGCPTWNNVNMNHDAANMKIKQPSHNMLTVRAANISLLCWWYSCEMKALVKGLEGIKNTRIKIEQAREKFQTLSGRNVWAENMPWKG